MKLLLSIIFLLPILSSAQVGSSCQDRINGEFICLDEEFKGWEMNIKDSVMVQFNSEYDLKITSSIEWISECEFSNTITKVKGSNLQGLLGISNSVKITRLNPKSLVIETLQDGELVITNYQKKNTP